MRGLSGRTVLVTGAASGIGRACAARFVAEGCHVVVADVAADRGEATARELGENARFVRTDVTDEDSVAAAVDAAVEWQGGLDVLFASAAVLGAVGPIADTSTADMDLTLAINLRGTLLCLKHAARVMVPRRSGAIITTASAGGIIGGQGPHVYAATKAGVIGLTRSVAAEVRAHGVRVNAVIPGAIVSAMTADAVSGDPAALEHTAEKMAPHALLGRPGVPEDIAGAVAFLASDEAGYMTGSELLVDAGYTWASGAAVFARGKLAGAPALMGAAPRPDLQRSPG